tara:strand:+ start:835 stop:1032 length:198 start_codon:yes stop_codon:yes gene_type:complete
MWKKAIGAILDPGFEHRKTPSAIIKKVQRTKAEQAVELIRLFRLVTGKVLAILITKKSIATLHLT